MSRALQELSALQAERDDKEYLRESMKGDERSRITYCPYHLSPDAVSKKISLVTFHSLPPAPHRNDISGAGIVAATAILKT